MTTKDGGPAFARPIGRNADGNVADWNDAQDGMSLRDVFAAVALGPLITEFMQLPADRNCLAAPDGAAKFAYQIADAMLAERERKT